MTGRAQKTSRPVASILCGLVGTLAVLAIHLAGLNEHAELDALDSCFRHVSKLDSPDGIVHVDIDDGALTELGRWPWPRAQMAGILEVLDECGARQIAMDVIFPDPQNVRYVSEADEVYSEDVGAELLSEAPPIPVFDDLLLAEAIAATRAVVAMHMDLDSGDQPARSRTPSQIAWQARAVESLGRYAVPPSQVEDYPLAQGPVIPPLVTFSEAAALSGFVTIKPDSDGVVRHMRLLAKDESAIYAQFALALAAWDLTSGHDPIAAIHAEPGAVTITPADGEAVTIPVDGQGRMLVNWVAPERETTTIISAAAIGSVWRQRQSLKTHHSRIRMIQLQLVSYLGDGALMMPFIQQFGKGDQVFQQINAHHRQRYLAMLNDPANVPPPPVELLEAESEIEAKIDVLAEKLRQRLETFEPESAELRDKVARLRAVWDELEAANERIQRDMAEQLVRIRQRVEGKLCLIGASATGVGDFVPTPIHSRAAGVRLHSAVVNTILSGQFIRPASLAASLGIIAALGLVVSLVAGVRPMLQAAVVTVVLAAGYVAVGAYVLFGQLGYWAPLVAPPLAMAASFLLVALYRQLTEERAKRRIKAMFSHAMSPALVDELLSDPSLAELGGQSRILTCMFSDLAGFTPLSHELGPQQTVQVLNRYFDTMTDVIQIGSGGYLNKFLGDGIFCFFGAPVMQDDHAARSVRSAVECQRRVVDLNASLAAEFGLQAALAVRVGLTTGEAMVGNCGSSERMDYTAIGDCVNLASRLESANKDFYTRILVEDTTWREAALPDLAARLVGRVRIRGVADPVTIWDVLPTAADDELTQALKRFGDGVGLFQAARFADAREVFQDVGKGLPGDYLTQLYLALCEYGLKWSPGKPWQPSCDEGDVGRIAPPTPGD